MPPKARNRPNGKGLLGPSKPPKPGRRHEQGSGKDGQHHPPPKGLPAQPGAPSRAASLASPSPKAGRPINRSASGAAALHRQQASGGSQEIVASQLAGRRWRLTAQPEQGGDGPDPAQAPAAEGFGQARDGRSRSGQGSNSDPAPPAGGTAASRSARLHRAWAWRTAWAIKGRRLSKLESVDANGDRPLRKSAQQPRSSSQLNPNAGCAAQAQAWCRKRGQWWGALQGSIAPRNPVDHHVEKLPTTGASRATRMARPG